MAKTRTEPTLADALHTYRSMAQQGERLKTQRMYLLLDIKRDGTWHVFHSTWQRFLVDERLCPVAYFSFFETATTLYRRSQIDEIGVDAAVVLAKAEPAVRDELHARIRAHIKRFSTPPTRRLMWHMVANIRATQTPVRRTSGRQATYKH